ncbi:MAG TPA: hypothetical protein VIF62_33600 [Labilithrix sp.]|jgi:hypothetical protein
MISACGSLVGVQGQPGVGDDGSNDPSQGAPSQSNAPPPSSAAAATSTTPPPAPTPAKLAFVTSAAIAGADPELASRSSADALCNGLAAAAGFGGRTFAAWLSDDFVSAVDADVVKAGVRYARPDGATIANDIVAAMKTNTSFTNPIAIDEKLGSHTGSVWTFTTDDGSTGETCAQSGSDSIQSPYNSVEQKTDSAATIGTLGLITTDPKAWTESGVTSDCNQKKPIYCFER